jgi:hypothetical protein
VDGPPPDSPDGKGDGDSAQWFVVPSTCACPFCRSHVARASVQGAVVELPEEVVDEQVIVPLRLRRKPRAT